MRKCVILIIGLFMSYVCFAQSDSFGDVNDNGEIDIIDALLIAQFTVHLDPPGFNEAVSDLDCSGSITILDALIIAQYYVGLISRFPCEPATNTPERGLTIYFVRHAETLANATGEMTGDGPMEDHEAFSTLGHSQVEALKDFLIEEDIVPDVILVSPTWRTQKTIESYLVATGAKAVIWAEFNECCGQAPSGGPIPTARPYSWWKLDVEIVADNIEFGSEEDSYYWYAGSYEEGIFMIRSARDRLLEHYSQSGKTIMIIGHAVNGSKLLGLLTGYDIINDDLKFEFWLLNTNLIQIEQDIDSGEFELKDQWINSPPR